LVSSNQDIALAAHEDQYDRHTNLPLTLDSSTRSRFRTVVLAFLNVGPEGIGHDKHQVPPNLQDRPINDIGWDSTVLPIFMLIVEIRPGFIR
jgi:hypothetical protein